MKKKIIVWIAVVAMGVLLLNACSSHSNDVATLKTTEGTQVEATGEATDSAGEATDSPLDDEAMMMAFTDCLREQGLEVMDPVVDADGNVGAPGLPEGVDKGVDKKTITAAWEACEDHLGGFTAEKERQDMSELIDQYVAFATCMRERGHDVEDPTAETLDQWDFKSTIDWNDPDATADYEECIGETLGEGSSK